MSLRKSFTSALAQKKKKGWDYLYVAVDIHGTVLKSNYSNEETPTEFYPNAIQALQVLTAMKGVKLIMFTSSRPEHVRDYDNLLRTHNIKFDFFNENPDVPSEGFGYFEHKFYFNLLLDDKACFDADGQENDWAVLIRLITGRCMHDMSFFMEHFVAPHRILI